MCFLPHGCLISVLVPTCERHELLVETLKGLVAQTYEPKEIIVYDQSRAHPPDVENYLKAFEQKNIYVKGSKKGLVSAYRKSVDLSQGQLCIFVDDDVIIEDPEFVSRHVENYVEPLIGAVSGRVINAESRTIGSEPPSLRSRFGWMHVRFNIAERLEELPSLCGANMSFRRDVYDAVEGFDRNYLGGGFRFETDFTFSVKKAGYRVIFDPAPSLFHRYRQAGGADNRFLFSLADDANHWYEFFFGNTWYFLRKWYPWPLAVCLFYLIWREHAFNRATLGRGWPFVLKRHQALLKGLQRHGRRRRNQGMRLSSQS